MAKRSERVTRMMENYFLEWQAGKSISEIALKYRVTTQTIYERLQEIADANNVTRSSLLQVPHKKHQMSGTTVASKKPPLDIAEVQEELDEIIEKTKYVICDIKEILNELQQEVQ